MLWCSLEEIQCATGLQLFLKGISRYSELLCINLISFIHLFVCLCKQLVYISSCHRAIFQCQLQGMLHYSIYCILYYAGTFIDYKSILNQYCQKNKINQPRYSEASATFGGFASHVSVKNESYCSHGDHKTKKSAAQSAAMWALLHMEIPEGKLC